MSTVQCKVVVGMPVYNGAATLVPVIESLLGQTYRDFVLLISDNCSTDKTEQICLQFCTRDPRVVYVRQPSNIGAEANFDFVLSQSDGEFFMWAAADDVRSSNFLEVNLKFLDQNSDYLGATSPTRFEGGEFNSLSMGDATRDEEDPTQRIANFFGCWHSNGRFYSVFRREAIKDWRSATLRFLASDWFFVLSLLKKGKLKRVDEGYVVLGRKGLSNGYGIFSIYRKRFLNWFFPFYDLTFRTLDLIGPGNIKAKLKVLFFLAKINLAAVRLQLQCELKKRAAS
jgi:glycosyltransferase involved in cell wall biosynthesis